MTAIIQVLKDMVVGLFGGTLGDQTIAGAIPTFWTWLTSADVLPYFLVGVAVSLILLGVKLVKGIFWGV